MASPEDASSAPYTTDNFQGAPPKLETKYSWLLALPWGPAWNKAVRLFVEGERDAGFPNPEGNQYSIPGRPKAYAEWFKRGRKQEGPNLNDVPAFFDEVAAWYRAMQPPGRGSSGVDKVALPAAAWSTMRKPGRNGFHLVMQGVHWVGRAIFLGSKVHAALQPRWLELVEDIAWALQASQGALAALASTGGASASDGPDSDTQQSDDDTDDDAPLNSLVRKRSQASTVPRKKQRR